MLKKSIFTLIVICGIVLMTACKPDKYENRIIGIWKYETGLTERTNNNNPEDVKITEQTPNNLTLNIREFRHDGTMLLYRENSNVLTDNEYRETWDWLLSKNERTLYLTNGRNNTNNEIDYIDHEEKIVKLNKDQLIVRYTYTADSYTFVEITTYRRL